MQHSPQAVPGQIGKKSVLKGERNKRNRKPQSERPKPTYTALGIGKASKHETEKNSRGFLITLKRSRHKP
jgi:hypothetical protein